MNSTLSKVLCFAAGAAVGSVVTWKLVKTKYEQLMHESNEIMREMYSADSESSDEEDESDEQSEYEEVVEELGYAAAAEQNEKPTEEKEDEEEVDRPYVISPEEFDDGDYEKESLDYFEGNGVLADTYGEVVEDVDAMVGDDFASHFGEYEPDTVYVRNDALETDFEICRDLGSFSEE